MDAIEAVKKRRSVRSFRADPVPKDVVEDLVDCGRLAPTAMNLQPWAFLAVSRKPALERIAALTDHGEFIQRAPLCIAVFCSAAKYFLEDGVAATENILIAACAHGLGSCWVAGYRKPYADRVRMLLGVPEGWNLVSLLAVGYPEETPHPSKKPLSEVLHWEKW